MTNQELREQILQLTSRLRREVAEHNETKAKLTRYEDNPPDTQPAPPVVIQKKEVTIPPVSVTPSKPPQWSPSQADCDAIRPPLQSNEERIPEPEPVDSDHEAYMKELEERLGVPFEENNQ